MQLEFVADRRAKFAALPRGPGWTRGPSVKPMKRSQIKIHKRVAEQHDQEIGSAENGRSLAAPSGASGETQIGDVDGQNRERHNHLRITPRIAPAQPVPPDQAHDYSRNQGKEAHVDAAARHTVENVERRET